MLVLSSEVTIGDNRFTSIHNISITKSIHTLVSSAIIAIPTRATILNEKQNTSEEVTTSSVISTGDSVIIKLGYDGELVEEFEGVIKMIENNNPLIVHSENKLSLLSKYSLPENVKSLTNILDLVKKTSNIDYVAEHDVYLQNINKNNWTCLKTLEELNTATDNNLTTYLTSDKKIWSGLLYTMLSKKNNNMRPTISYKLGYNTPGKHELGIKAHSLKPSHVQYISRTVDGAIVSDKHEVTKELNSNYTKKLSMIANVDSLNLLGKEKSLALRYTGITGNFEAFLQPYCDTGNFINIINSREPSMNSEYFVSGTRTTFGTNGARRIIEVMQLK